MMRTICLCLTASMLLTLTACKQKESDRSTASEIVVGEYGSLTGSEATFGQSTHKGIMLAVDQINATGGVLGKRVRVVTEDDRGHQDDAIASVKKLIDQDNVIAVLGEVASSNSLAGGGVCQDKQVPMISPSSTNPAVTVGREWVFRTCFTDDFQAAVEARFAIKKGWKKIALLTCSDAAYSKGLTTNFKLSIADKAELVADEKYNSNDSDYSAQLTRIQSQSPDAVYLPGYYTNIVQILKQARGKLNLNVPFFGGDGWDSAELMTLGAQGNNCFFTNHYSPDEDRPEVKKFLADFQAKWHETPDAMAITGYDGAMVLLDAIKRAGKLDRQAIRDAIAQTKDFAGASGRITIDENRNCRKPIVVIELHDGGTRLVDTIQP